MSHAYGRAVALSALILLLSVVTAAQGAGQTSSAAAPEISYTVSMPKPYTHLLEVEMRLRGNTYARADLIMPVWTPGSYLVREFERNVQDFNAKDAGGRALRWAKTNKNTWRVETAGARELVITYS